MLKHYDDGKGKYQSHEVWMDNGIISIFNNLGRGYGDSFEDALEDYQRKVEEAKRELYSLEIYKDIPVKVNWMGKPL